jgi:AAA+ superfamily predicted ATPase
MNLEAPPLNNRSQSLPDWYPAWARRLADLYFSGTTSLFIVHGNVHDLVRCNDAGGSIRYCNVAEFIAAHLFGSWDIVLHYDLGRGLRPLAGSNAERLRSMAQMLAPMGDPSAWPRDPENVLLLIDRFIERNLIEEDPGKRRRIGMVLDYAQYLAPAGDLSSLSRGPSMSLVRMLGWAQNPYIKRANIAFCLVADKLSEVNDRLVQNPHVATVEIPMPDSEDRRAFALWASGAQDLSAITQFKPEELADAANGLSLVSLNVVLAQARQSGRQLDARTFGQIKKSMIERQCQGLLEFVEPKHTLELVVGQQAAQQRLREDAELILKGRLDASPMGYLICGPVGTGKSFLAECYAGSIGIPCVTLRSFRSKYVGETEGNLEQVLTVLRSLGPVVVIVDEADAALGNRQAEGDSGTSSRVFSMIASQMGDTRYRGRIIWMLLTSRPDLLPIDLKRQGRAEIHIPLFYPQNEDEIRRMFEVMARKNKIAVQAGTTPKWPEGRSLSGADVESVLLAAHRRALTAGRTEVTLDDAQTAVSDFVPSAQGLEKELQEAVAVMECTQLSFLPPDWRKRIAQPNGRSQLQERIAAIRQLIEE